jgi:hypothetical protein
VAVVAVGGYWLASQRQSTAELRSETSGAPAAPAVIQPSSADDVSGATGDGEPGDGEPGDAQQSDAPDVGAGAGEAVVIVGPEGTGDGAISSAESSDATAFDDGRPSGYDGDAPFAIFDGGILTLYGRVPSRDLSDRYQERFGNIVGAENVVNKYTVDPGFTVDEGQTTPVFVTDAVLFDFNSVALKSEYLYLLDYGALMLGQNPQATLTIVTYTDAVGSAETNLKVARLRAEEVLDYWIRSGVNPDQVRSEPRGEDGATDADDEATAALRRRAEFIITGLLD